MAVTSNEIMVVSALVVVLTYVRDLYVRMRQRHKDLTKEERESLREPVEVRGLVMDNTRDAVNLQSTILQEYRQDIVHKQEEISALRKRTAELETAVDLKNREIADLWTRLGRLQVSMEVKRDPKE